MMNRVRIVLRLQTQRLMSKVITGIQLDPGLRRMHFHHSPMGGFSDACGIHQLFPAPIDHIVVVVAIHSGFELFDAGTHGIGRCKVQRGILNAGNLSCGNELAISDRILIRINVDHMSEHITRPGKVEIGMIRKIDNSGFVGGRLVVQGQSIVPIQCICNRDIQVAGIALFAISTMIKESHGDRVIGSLHDRARPHDTGKSFSPTMNVIGSTVGSELELFPVELKSRTGNPVCHTTNHSRRTPKPTPIIFKRSRTKDHVLHSTRPIRNQDFSNDLGGNLNVSGRDDMIADRGIFDEDDHDPEDIIVCNIQLSGVPTSPICFGDNTGSIDVTIIGGKAPYMITWSDGLGAGL